MNQLTQQRQQGFTIIELVIVIVIIGIIAIGSTEFIVNAAKGLNDTKRRAALARKLTIASEKIERQIQHSLPHSIRIRSSANSQCIEMLPIQASAFFARANSAKTLTAIGLKRNVIGLSAHLSEQQSAVIYTSNIVSAQRSQAQTNSTLLTLTKPLPAPTSAGETLHFVAQPLSFCIQGDKLFRYRYYPRSHKQRLAKQLPRKEPHRALVSNGLLPGSQFRLEDNRLQILLVGGDSKEQLTLNQYLQISHE